MCGIVGILGQQDVASSLVDALKRLEYRGYDSAGIATLNHGVLDRRLWHSILFRSCSQILVRAVCAIEC